MSTISFKLPAGTTVTHGGPLPSILQGNDPLLAGVQVEDVYTFGASSQEPSPLMSRQEMQQMMNKPEAPQMNPRTKSNIDMLAKRAPIGSIYSLYRGSDGIRVNFELSGGHSQELTIDNLRGSESEVTLQPATNDPSAYGPNKLNSTEIKYFADQMKARLDEVPMSGKQRQDSEHVYHELRDAAASYAR